jgi:phosphohistidine phosphatase
LGAQQEEQVMVDGLAGSPKEGTLRLYILRHATAQDRGPGISEAARQLTPEGRLELKTVLRLARGASVRLDAILTSPWTRALDSAQTAATALKCDQVIETRALLPDGQPAQVLREVRAAAASKAKTKAKKAILVAGHEPQLSRLVAFLLEAPLAIDFKKGGLVRIDIEEKEGPPRGVLKWMITPRVARGKA